jgi:O-antigen/teichoic acid export membrane protein
MGSEGSAKVVDLVISTIADSLIYIPTQLVPAILGFFALAFYTRVFSPSDYGDYSLLIVTISILSVFIYSWMNSSMLRFFSAYERDDTLQEFLSTSFFTIVILLISVSIPLLILSSFGLLPYPFSAYVAVVMGYLISTALFETAMTVLRADRKAREVTIFRILCAGASLGVSLVLILIFHTGISGILFGTILVGFLLSLILGIRFRAQHYIRVKNFSQHTLRKFAGFGVPYIGSLIFTWILAISDRYFVEYFRGPTEVGIYSAAYTLGSYPIGFISGILVLALVPIVYDTWEKKSETAVQELMSYLVKYYLVLCLPLMFGLTALSAEFMRLLGSRYTSGEIIIPWIAVGSFALGLSMFYQGLELHKKTKIVLLLTLIAGIGNAFLNLILVPLYGMYGAGISTALSYIIFLGLFMKVAWKYLPWRFPTRSLINCTAASGIMVAVLEVAKASLLSHQTVLDFVLLAVIGSGVYLLLVYATGEIRNELVVINQHLRRSESVQSTVDE